MLFLLLISTKKTGARILRVTYTDCHPERYYLKVSLAIQNEVWLFMPATSYIINFLVQRIN